MNYNHFGYSGRQRRRLEELALSPRRAPDRESDWTFLFVFQRMVASSIWMAWRCLLGCTSNREWDKKRNLTSSILVAWQWKERHTKVSLQNFEICPVYVTYSSRGSARHWPDRRRIRWRTRESRPFCSTSRAAHLPSTKFASPVAYSAPSPRWRRWAARYCCCPPRSSCFDCQTL